MSVDDGADPADLDRLLHEARDRLASMRAAAAAGARPGGGNGDGSGGSGGGRAEDVLPVRAVGTALEGQVRAVAAAGRLETLEFDARLMRLPARDLAAPVTEAVNLALDDMRARSAAADADIEPAPSTDPDVLADRLRDVHAQGVRTMDMITQGLSDAIARIQQRTYMSGDPGPLGLEPLLDQTARALDSFRAPDKAERSETAAGGVRGEASDPAGQVHAVAGSGGRIESLWIDEQAGRSGSYALAERTVAAVNAALTDLAAKQAESAAASAANAGRLAERLQEVQDMSLQQMRAYTGALRGMMSSIQGPE